MHLADLADSVEAILLEPLVKLWGFGRPCDVEGLPGIVIPDLVSERARTGRGERGWGNSHEPWGDWRREELVEVGFGGREPRRAFTAVSRCEEAMQLRNGAVGCGMARSGAEWRGRVRSGGG